MGIFLPKGHPGDQVLGAGDQRTAGVRLDDMYSEEESQDIQEDKTYFQDLAHNYQAQIEQLIGQHQNMNKKYET